MLLPLPGPRHIQRCGRRVSGKSNGAYCAYRRKLQRYDICTTGQLTSSSPEIGNFYARCKHTLGIGNIPGRCVLLQFAGVYLKTLFSCKKEIFENKERAQLSGCLVSRVHICILLSREFISA